MEVKQKKVNELMFDFCSFVPEKIKCDNSFRKVLIKRKKKKMKRRQMFDFAQTNVEQFLHGCFVTMYNGWSLKRYIWGCNVRSQIFLFGRMLAKTSLYQSTLLHERVFVKSHIWYPFKASLLECLLNYKNSNIKWIQKGWCKRWRRNKMNYQCWILTRHY